MRQLYMFLRPGVCTDGTGGGSPVEFYFSRPDLVPGDKFSADIKLGTENEIDDATIFVESGPSAAKENMERPEFESAGPAPGIHGWSPIGGTPDTGLNGGRPDTGRFSHPTGRR